MICVTKVGFEMCLKSYKTSSYYAGDLVDTYVKGAPSLGIKKNLKKAIKVLKYWEKKVDETKAYYLVYRNLMDIYKELGKYELSDMYGIKYFRSNLHIEDTSLGNYYYRNLLELEIKYAVDSKGKIKNKEFALDIFNNFKGLLRTSKSTIDFTYSKYKDKFIALFSSEAYKNLCYVHILQGLFNKYKVMESDALIRTFSESDFLCYLEVLDYPIFKSEIEFKKVVKVFYENKYKPSLENQLKYAYAIGPNATYANFNYNLSLALAQACYAQGMNEAVPLICDLYKSVRYKDKLFTFLEEHIKNHKNDIHNMLLLADYSFEYYYDKNKGASDSKKIKKAIDIYEKNVNKLTNTQLDLLSYVYVKGHVVEMDLDKAKLYSKSHQAEIDKQERLNELKFVDDIVLKAPFFKKHLDVLKKGVLENNDKAIIDLMYMLERDYIVEKNTNIKLKLAHRLFENKNRYGVFYLYGVNRKGENADTYYNLTQSVEDGYKYLAQSLKLSDDNASEEEQREVLMKACEFNNCEALSEYAHCLRNGILFEKDIDKSYEIYKGLVIREEYNHCRTYFTRFNLEKREADNLIFVYEHSKKCADMINLPVACYRTYALGLKLKKLNSTSAFEYLMRAVNNGHIKACEELGKMYYYGDESPIKQDYKKAYDIFTGILENSDIAAYYVGLAYYYGNGVKADYKKAVELFERVSEKISNAKVFLARCYRFGYGVKIDLTKAIKLYEEASSGSDFALYNYALLYSKGIEGHIEIDYKKAINLMLEASKTLEDDEIYFELGYCYRQIDDFKNTEKYYKKCIKLNSKNTYALYNLGCLYRTDGYDKKDYKESLNYFDLAYKAGDPDGALEAAKLLMLRNYGMNDSEKAFPYLNAAYEAKVVDSEVYIAYYYLHYKDDHKAAYNYIVDSKSEDQLKYLVLGNIYYDGKHLSRDYTKAFECFNKAYELFQENPYVWYRLGRCYYFGYGVLQDKNRAYDFMSEAAKDDFMEAKDFIEEYFKNR